MHFVYPHLLWLLLLVPPLSAVLLWWSAKKRRALLSAFIQARLLPGLLAGVSEPRQRFRSACFVLALCCVIVALARPRWGFSWEEVKQRGLDIVVAIDISKSMLAEDVPPNRLARAKLAALDLMQRAHSDRLGLVAFAGSAFLQCPLTIDDSVFRQSVDGLDVQSISRGGTAISDAISTAMGAFTEGDNYKILVLLTDGEDHDSGALETARRAVEKGLEIFCVGIGTPAGDLVRAPGANGKLDFVRDAQGNAVKSRLNETLLQQVAGLSHRGFYLPLRGAKTIDTLYEKGLAPIPKREGGEKFVKRYHERFQWPLGAAIVLLVIEMVFPERKRPRPARPSLVKEMAALVLFGFLLTGMSTLASPRSAGRAYESGDYETALKQYKQLLRSRKDDPRLHFNAGDAAYKGQQLEEAARQFNEALSSQDLQLQQRAYYNRGNTFYAMGEKSPDPVHKTEAWERAIKDFESALKLNPKDGDAAFNRNFVEQKLEELKKQQEQQPSEDQSQKQGQNNQQQQPQQGEQKNEPEKNRQNQPQQQQQAENQQKPSDQQPGAQPQQQPQPEKGEQQKPEKEQQQPESPGSEQKPSAGQEQEASPGEMTPEQARRLLDAEKGDEKVLQFRPEEHQGSSSRPLKDW